MRKFEFKKAYEEIEISGDVYRIDMSDQKIKEYQVEFHEFYKDSRRFEKINVEELEVEEQAKVLDDALAMVKKITESLLGKGTFEELYKKSGKSINNMIDLIDYLADIVEQKLKSNSEKKRNKYLKHKKGNKKKRK